MTSITYLKCAFISFVCQGLAIADLPRAVSLSPQVSDLVIEAGFAPALVGSVTRYSGPPHEMAELGSYLHPNAEKIFALKPDWILTDDGVPPSAARSRWEAQGSKTLVLKLGRVSDLASAVAQLSERLFAQPSATAQRIERCLAKVDALPKTPKSALVFVSLSPPILAAKGAFLHDLISRAGYENLTDPKWNNSYPLVTEEWLIARRPEVVFYLDYNFGERSEIAGKLRKWWPHLSVIATGLPQEPFSRATLNVLKHWETLSLGTPKECREVF